MAREPSLGGCVERRAKARAEDAERGAKAEDRERTAYAELVRAPFPERDPAHREPAPAAEDERAEPGTEGERRYQRMRKQACAGRPQRRLHDQPSSRALARVGRI